MWLFLQVCYWFKPVSATYCSFILLQTVFSFLAFVGTPTYPPPGVQLPPVNPAPPGSVVSHGEVGFMISEGERSPPPPILPVYGGP